MTIYLAVKYGLPLVGIVVTAWGFMRGRKVAYIAFALYWVLLFVDPPFSSHSTSERHHVPAAPQTDASALTASADSSFVEAYILRVDPVLVLLGLFLLACQERQTPRAAADSSDAQESA